MLRFIVVCGLTILVSMTFLACQQEREETFPDNRPVVFAPLHSVWGGGVQSRVIDDAWEGDEQVGIYMLEHGVSPENAIVYAANVPYKFEDKNSPTYLVPGQDGYTIFYPFDDSPVNFVAYHPYRNNIVGGDYLVDVHAQANLKEIDLLIHDGVGTPYHLNDGKVVPLTFKHKLTKLVITAETSDTGIDLTEASLTITGMPTAACFNLYSCTFTGLSLVREIDPVLIYSSYDQAEWEALIIPYPAGDFPGGTFTITIGGATYIYAPDDDFESGKVYTYSFELK